MEKVSVSLSAYYNDYADLRTVEFGPTVIPLIWGNRLQGRTYGLESWGDVQVQSWWRLSAGLNLLSKDLSFTPGASRLLGVAQAGDDPPAQGQLKSAMNLGSQVTLDLDARYVAALPAPYAPAYTELNTSLAWSLTRHLQLGLAGLNLLQARHLEWAAPFAAEVPRSIQGEVRYRY